VSKLSRIRHAWGAAGPSSPTWRLKKVLAALILVGSMTFTTIGGVYALLNAETQNSGASIAAGTLTFSNQVGAGTICTSWGAGSTANVNSACSPLFTSATTIYPGTAGTVHLTIKDDGSLPTTNLSVFMPSCTMTTTPGAPSPGGGNPCTTGGDLFYIQETDASFTPTNCKFPAAAGTCGFVADSLSVFGTTYTSTATSLSLGSGPTAGGFRYFIIGLQLPTTAANNLQGEAATFDLTWQVST
jgi:hypothetical protein